MYNCEECNQAIGPRIPQNRVITEMRDKQYFYPSSEKHPNGLKTNGSEIVREKIVCNGCERKLNQEV